jgi:FtsP/CotA-like multicopper oxidase with cupredoxin domain
MKRRHWLEAAFGLPLLAACSSTARLDFRLPDSFCATPLPRATAEDVELARVRIAAEPLQRLLHRAHGNQADEPGSSQRTAIWSYTDASNAALDSPVIRARQGELLPVLFENRLPTATTVHWHGLRLHNSMDGVPQVTQGTIASAERFLYRLACRDAGTFWYHPHVASQEQLVRGLAGAFIVSEDQPIAVEQDLVWLLKDWLLDDRQQIRGDFEDTRDMSHAGRIGNRVTLNGEAAQFAERDPAPLRLPVGARIRLRLINAASARSFVLKFESDSGLQPLVAAFDGFPCPLHHVDDNQFTLAAAQRLDLLFDMPAGRVIVRDLREARRPFVLREMLGTAQSGQSRSRSPIVALPPNRWLEPQLAEARTLDVIFEGGARGQLRSARVGNQSLNAEQLLERYNMNWTINGVASRDHDPLPFLTVRCNDTVLLRMRNESAWHHPIHLHGFHFKVLSIDGKAPPVTTVRDTFMMEPRSRAEIAFVADNPGTWMFHCHILQHQAGGMMAALKVE